MPWATIPETLDAILMGQFATGRIDPLLIAETAEEMLCYLDFAEPRFKGDERQDVVCKRHARSIHDPGFSMAGPMGQGFPNCVLASQMFGAGASAERTCWGSMLATSPKTPGKTRRAFVDAAFAFDELTQWLIQVLVLCRVPQNPRPFAPRPIIDLVAICRA